MFVYLHESEDFRVLPQKLHFLRIGIGKGQSMKISGGKEFADTKMIFNFLHSAKQVDIRLHNNEYIKEYLHMKSFISSNPSKD